MTRRGRAGALHPSRAAQADTPLPIWHPRRWLRNARALIVELAEEHSRELLGAAGAFIYTVVRATGVQVNTGFTAVRFTCGRAGRELHPGFHFLVPFLQRAPQVATRARTLDLPSQRVATAEGLVYLVDSAIQFRVVDPRRALVEVDQLDRALLRMVAMAVQAVLFGAGPRALSERTALERELAERLSSWTSTWGVEIERAGFTSLTPSPKTLRVTQLRQAIHERERLRALIAESLPSERAVLGLLGPRALPVRRALTLRAPSAASRSARRVAKLLVSEGLAPHEIARARRRLEHALGEESAKTRELLAGADARSMREKLLAKSERESKRATARVAGRRSS